MFPSALVSAWKMGPAEVPSFQSGFFPAFSPLLKGDVRGAPKQRHLPLPNALGEFADFERFERPHVALPCLLRGSTYNTGKPLALDPLCSIPASSRVPLGSSPAPSSDLLPPSAATLGALQCATSRATACRGITATPWRAPAAVPLPFPSF